jgi:CRISPR-associated endoribonuclease Cas6
MFTSVVVTVRPENDIALPATMGHGLHAAFLDLVSQHNPRLADKLHAPGRSKPFTISPLYGDFIPNNGTLHLKSEESYWFRVTSLDPSLSALLAEFTPASIPSVTLFSEGLPIVAVAKDANEHPWAGQISAEELYESHVLANNLPRSFTLQFHSPTTFRSGGQNMPFPLPRFIFLTLAEKWNRYSPVHLGEEIAPMLAERVQLARYDLRTRMLDFGRYRQVGFTGRCEFRIEAKKDDLWGKIPHLLADFAFYAGVGYKTTMGMGQVQRM